MNKSIQSILVIITGFFLLYPIFFVVSGSLMNPAEMMEYLKPLMNNSSEYVRWSFLPQRPTLSSWIEVLMDTPEFFVMFWNSIKVSVLTCILQLFIAVPTAWKMAVYKYKGQKIVYCLYIMLALTPFSILMLPQYMVLQSFGLIDTLYVLILPGVFSTFPILIIHSFMKKIPSALIEMARTEGASEVYIFFHVGLPLIKEGIILSILYSFVEQWSLFEQPLLFLKTESYWTLPIYLTNIELEQSHLAFSASVFTMILPILLLGIAKDKLENGISDIFLKE